jgi:tripartite-type tricarboxylate transporter receptor subunit TctC
MTHEVMFIGRGIMRRFDAAGIVGSIALLILGSSLPAHAQDYPNKPIRVVLTYTAGGVSDGIMRLLAPKMEEVLGQKLVIEAKPGAAGNLGTIEVAKSAPDGYTLLTMSNTHTTNESLTPNKPFQLMRDFVPVAGINYSDLVMVVHPSVPAKDVKEFIALAKKEPDKLNFASSGPATPYHMAGELFKHMTGTKIVHVPHKASGEMRSSVIGGHVQMGFDAVTTMTENVKAGKVRALGTSATKRSKVLPDVPTIAEAGVPGYESTIWIGIMAPKGTPQAVVDKLNTEINKAIGRPEVLAAWDKQGAVPLAMKPAEFDAYLRKDIEKWANVVNAAGLAKKE